MYFPAVDALIEELRAGGRRVLQRYDTVDTVKGRTATFVFERALVGRGGKIFEVVRYVGHKPPKLDEELTEDRLRARLIEEPHLRRWLGLPEPGPDAVLAAVLGELRSGRIYRDGGGDHHPQVGTTGFEEVLRYEDGLFVHESREWLEPPGGPNALVREAVARYDEAGLRGELGRSSVLARLLRLREG